MKQTHVLPIGTEMGRDLGDVRRKGSIMVARIGLALAVLLAIAAVAASGIAMAQARSRTPSLTITTIGHGSADIVPDTATVNIGVQTTKETALASLNENAKNMTAIIAALRKLDIPASAIQTTNFSMYQNPELHTYQVTHDLTVHVGADRLSQVYATAAGAGANTFGGVSFGATDRTSARDRALKAALADARHRAEIEAQTLGVQVSGVQLTSEATSTTALPCGQGCGGGNGPPPIQSGQLTVTTDVGVTYKVR